MPANPPETPSNQLFNRYLARYAPEHDFRPPRSGADTAEVWTHLCRETGVTTEQLCNQIAALASLPVHDGSISPAAQLLDPLPRKMLERFYLAPVAQDGEDLILAIANPFNELLLEQIKFVFGLHYKLVIAAPDTILQAIAAADKAGTEAMEQANNTTRIGKYVDTMDAAIPRLVTEILTLAVGKRASDLHLQPFTGGSLVRLRVDGALQRVVLLPEPVAKSVIRFFKAQAGMDPTLDIVPQDGRMDIDIAGKIFDLRISTLPVAGHQEKLVIRFLGRQSVFKLSAIGFSLDEVHTLERMAASPSGVVLVCGPTGSGKSTTLYSILGELNQEDTSVMTVENPVEYQMSGLSQTEINDKAGMTFPRALRAILRQDPDVLLIGEIRDNETAQIAMQAALTGHLVFSTLHTNDSLSAIPRLLDLGIKPVILAEALTGILSQRLLRKLCNFCKQPCSEENDPFAVAFRQATRSQQAARAVGCEHCNHTGYSGRTVIAEILEITQPQRELLLGGETDIMKFKAAMRGNFNTLAISASRLIISGITTAAQASAVLGQQFWIDLAHEYQTPMPDLSLLGSGGSTAARSAVLIAGSSDDVMEQHLREAWLDVFTAKSPAEAKAQLQANENIRLVVLDIAEDMSETAVIGLVAEYRKEMAWSRLPALIRIPPQHPELIPLLRQHGSTSRIIGSDTHPDAVVEIIQQALNKNLDFKWGLQQQ